MRFWRRLADGQALAARFPEDNGSATEAEAQPASLWGARKHPHLMLWLIVVVCVSSLLGVYWAKNPAYNWDMLGYIAVALVDAGTPTSKIHDMTYASMNSIPKRARDALIEDGGYRSHVARDAERFMDELPFYSVKPLYPWLISLLYRAGAQLPMATVIVSAISYALIPILLFLWFSNFAPGAFAAPLACCLAVTPFLRHIAVLSTPDSTSVLIVLAALYLSLEKERHGAAAATLIFSILARPEDVIYAGSFFCYLAVTRKLSLWPFAASCLAALVLFFTLIRMSGYYGYKELIYSTFVNYDIDVKHFVSPFGLKDYALIYVDGLSNLFLHSNFGIFASLALGAVGITAVRRSWSDKYFHIVVLAGICAAARYAILPADYSRALLVPYMMVLIAFVAVCCSLAAARRDAPPRT